MDNLTYGLDIATAISVIGAAVLFIWNSTKNNRNLQKERHRAHIKSSVLKVTDKLNDEVIKLFDEIQIIMEKLLQGETTQDLTPYKLRVERLPFIFKTRIDPIDKVYGNGRFKKLVKEYDASMDEAIHALHKLTKGESTGEKWDFEEVMYKPVSITTASIAELFFESERLIETI